MYCCQEKNKHNLFPPQRSKYKSDPNEYNGVWGIPVSSAQVKRNDEGTERVMAEQ